ncbi:TolC family protein [Aeromonas media]|uniref:TolC family protein n=1 Tax=Aeromonas media TaxID=651 RepID=UPI0029D6248D|nr:TolC family protein [Aeromonas media]MDX7899818.1 TolC family protein [Aeromonas media]
MPRLAPRPLTLTSSLLLCACSALPPETYTEQDKTDRIRFDRQLMYDQQEPVIHPLTFYEAAARALKYNLDYRLKLMEGALAADLRDLSSHEMLPQLVASAGLAGRSNESGGTSVGIEDGEESLRASTSQERYRDLSGLGLSWSLLDFGVAYYRNQQKGDQVLMAEERRRKVAQNVLQDVRSAYWRALGAQRLLPEVDKLLARTRVALNSARQAETQGLLPRQQALAYQRALIDSVSLLNQRRQDLEFARAELAALISLPSGSKMVLADDTPEPRLPTLAQSIDHLELMALENRPEIMEEWYRKRANQQDIKIAKAELWPNVSLNWGYNYDSNQYLYNNHWSETGLQVSINLLKFLRLPAIQNMEVSQKVTDDARRVALSMAVLTQVRVGVLRYNLAAQEVAFADESLRVDESLLRYAQAARTSDQGSELEVIRTEGRYLLSRYQREAAYSQAQAAWGRLYNSVGLDVQPEAIAQHDVQTLAKAIEHTIKKQENQALLTSNGGVPYALPN